MESLDEWFARGAHARLAGRTRPDGRGSGPRDFEIFYRRFGGGPWLTLLHGFPTCSWDWAPVVEPLGARRSVLAFDFLGFGDSSRPARHRYSLFEQADLTEALWRELGVAETGLVAHDYGASVALELIARQAQGALRARVTGLVLLNAGLYLDLYRPLLVQRLLRLPVFGALVSRLIDERAFARSFAAVFSPAHPLSAAELHAHWRAVSRHGGARLYHRLSAYIAERRRQRARFEAALERPGVPLGLLWGGRDPVSGAPVLERLRERCPAARVTELPDVGHYPQLEVPETVAAELLSFFAAQG